MLLLPSLTSILNIYSTLLTPPHHKHSIQTFSLQFLYCTLLVHKALTYSLSRLHKPTRSCSCMHLHSRLFQWAFLPCSRSFFQPVPLPSKLEASEDSFTPSSCAEAVYPESFGGVSYSTQNAIHVNVVYSTYVCTVRL